jgi:hypothetical protein
MTADIAIVGAGAAGLMTAIAAAGEKGPARSVLLLDSRKKIGAKILMSGGTRCNVTNVKVTPHDFEGGPKHIVKHVLEAFTPDETMKFFESIGVHLVLEPTGKYFPTTHSGKTVLEALVKEAEKRGVRLLTDARVASMRKEGDLFILSGGAGEIAARKVILTTGGLSYPETGSDGTGFEIAKSFGHSIVRTVPALTPLATEDAAWKSLSGVTLETRLSFYEEGRKRAEREGSFLFTHFGFSGPAALDISRYFAGCEKAHSPRIMASFAPAETEESLGKRLAVFQMKHPQKMMKSFLTEELRLPESFVDVFLRKIEMDPKAPARRFPRAGGGRLIHWLLNYPLEVTGVVGYKKAEVTAGGVDLKEIRCATMESRRVPGLYFAGEILDVDGRIGGFNFQWSWSSGTVAGRSAARSLLS